MNDDLAHCLLELYLTAMELLGTGVKVMEGLAEGSAVREELCTACIDAVLLTRSFSRRLPAHEVTWRIEQVATHLETAGALLRRLRARRTCSRPHLIAAIEIAERGLEAVADGRRMLAELQ